jgi:integrase
MGLKLLKDRNGDIRPTWYAELRRDGRAVRLNLGVKVRGTPGRNAEGNPTIHGGDRDFEASRREAEAKMKRIREASKLDAQDIMREAFRLRTGGDLEDVRLSDLSAKWRAIPRDPPATEEQLARADRIFADFAAFAASYTPAPDPTAKRSRRTETAERCATLNAVTPELVAAYFRHSCDTLAWATAAGRKHLLSSAWATFATTGGANPFKTAKIKRDKNDPADKTVHRSLLDEGQLERLFELAEPDAFLYPLIVCAASTGLRLGDVCRLRWDAVAFRDGRPYQLKVRTSKTGAEVDVPVFERFAAVLERRLAERGDEDGRGGPWDPLVYVFPEAARKYSAEGTQTWIVRSVKPLFARAVFGDAATMPDAEDAKPLDPAAVERAIAAAPWKTEKRDRILDIYRRHVRGDSYRVIREATGRSSPLISLDLHAVEVLIGRPVRKAIPTGLSTHEAMLARTRRRPEGRHRASSVYGWHSLRGTWATIALKRGVPKEAVAAVVGHATFETTWKNYIAKDQLAEEARRGLRGSVLDGGKASPAPAPRLVSAPSKAPALPAFANCSDAARAVRYLREWILDEDQRNRLATAADALGVSDDAPADLLPLAARILATDNQLDRALAGLRSARLLA